MLRTSCALAASLAVTATAHADIDFIFDSRLRLETVDQDNLPDDAAGLTWRARLGASVDAGEGLSFLLEGEHVQHLIDDFNDTLNGAVTRPVIADPEATELNRAQIAYAQPDWNVTIGRQRLISGDARYVGNVGYRQNEQTFDAVRLNLAASEEFSVSYSYIDRVHRILGDDSPGGEWDVNTHLATAAWQIGGGNIEFTGLLFDHETSAGLSTSTWAVGWRNAVDLGQQPVRYFIEFATQSDYADNPSSFDLDMWRAELVLPFEHGSIAFGIDWLEGNGSRGFSTPLATLHKFQGFADVFLATPADGLRDVRLTGRLTLPEPVFGQSNAISLSVHDFETERSGVDLGREIDLVLTAQFERGFGLMVKFADFQSDNAAYASRDKLAIALTYRR